MSVIPSMPKPTSSSTAMPACTMPSSSAPWQPSRTRYMPETVHVSLAERSYDIVVGERLLAQAGTYIAPLLKTRQAIIVSDETVAKFYLHRLTTSLEEAQIG